MAEFPLDPMLSKALLASEGFKVCDWTLSSYLHSTARTVCSKVCLQLCVWSCACMCI